MESIYYKELIQLRKDYGDLLITNTESQHLLNSLRNECDNLRASLIISNGEISSLNDQLTEVTIIKKQNRELNAEITRLESLKGVIEGENRELNREIAKLEQDLGEKLKEQKERGEIKYKKLENQYNSVMVAATTRYKELAERVLSLENDVEILKHDCPSSGSQLVDAAVVSGEEESDRNEPKSGVLVGVQSGYEAASNVERTTSIPVISGEQESDRHEPKSGVLVGVQSGHEATSNVERTTSMPGSRPVSATLVKPQPESSESESDTIPAKEKLAASVPRIPKPPSVSPSIINLGNSDDDAELSSQAALKRKLQTTGASDKREEDGGSSRKCIKSTDKTGLVLQPCVQKVGVESDSKYSGDHIPVEFSNSIKEWEYAADMLDSFQHDTELCMKGVCALSRHHMLSLREKALVKFLTDGDAKGRLKRTLAELKAYPDGAHECKTIAMIHHEELYGIYKGGNDPYFAHDTIFSQETM